MAVHGRVVRFSSLVIFVILYVTPVRCAERAIDKYDTLHRDIPDGDANIDLARPAFGRPPEAAGAPGGFDREEDIRGNIPRLGPGEGYKYAGGAHKINPNVEGSENRNPLPGGGQTPYNPPQAPPAQPRRPVAVKLSEHPACASDVKNLCSASLTGSLSNNFAVLDCLQSDLKVS